MANIGGDDLAFAESFYTIDADAEITDGETLVIAGKTYTFQDTLTDSDGNVHIGADHQATISNIVAAVNLSNEGESDEGAGNDYAESMTKNEEVMAFESEDTLTLRALVPGTAGNRIPLTAGTSDATVDNATLENGDGDIGTFIASVIDLSQINGEVLAELKRLTPEAD